MAYTVNTTAKSHMASPAPSARGKAQRRRAQDLQPAMVAQVIERWDELHQKNVWLLGYDYWLSVGPNIITIFFMWLSQVFTVSKVIYLFLESGSGYKEKLGQDSECFNTLGFQQKWAPKMDNHGDVNIKTIVIPQNM